MTVSAAFRPASEADLEVIRAIAWETWADTYGGEIEPETIQESLERNYALDTLRDEIRRALVNWMWASEGEAAACTSVGMAVITSR